MLASKYIRLSYLMSAAVVECGTCRCVCLGRAAYCVRRHVHHIFVFKCLGFGYTGENYIQKSAYVAINLVKVCLYI